MKRPEAAPDWRKTDLTAILSLRERADVSRAIQQANREYFYWDKVRSRPCPKGLKREELWALIKLQRSFSLQRLPFNDVDKRAFSYWLPLHLQESLHGIDTLSEEDLAIDRWQQKRGGLAKHLIQSLMEEAITSSQVEGAATTMRDAKRMLLSGRKPRGRSEQMIYNNYQTMQAIKDLANEPLTPALIKKIHRKITRGTMPDKDLGRYRRAKEEVVIEGNRGEILFVPPPASTLKTGIETLCHFANGDKGPFVHPVIRAIILHFYLAYLHPFLDGNGRTARALFYWYLIKHGYWYFEYLSISKIILKRLGQYGRAYLYTEVDEADVTYFIHFHLKVVLNAVEALQEYLDQERYELEVAVSEITDYPDLNLRQSRLLVRASRYPQTVFTIREHQRANGIAYQTARSDLFDLEQKGILKRIKKGKSYYFVLSDGCIK